MASEYEEEKQSPRKNWTTHGSCRVPCGPFAARMFASASCLCSPACAGMTSLSKSGHPACAGMTRRGASAGRVGAPGSRPKEKPRSVATSQSDESPRGAVHRASCAARRARSYWSSKRRGIGNTMCLSRNGAACRMTLNPAALKIRCAWGKYAAAG